MAELEPTLHEPVQKHLRRWFQFSLRTIFIVVTVVGVAFGTLVVQVIIPAERQRAAVEKLKALGGGVSVKYADPPAEPSWLRRLLTDYLPRDYFDPVTCADLSDGPCRDDDLVCFVSLPQLQLLNLHRTPKVTDAGLAHLAGLTQLQVLSLDGTQVTDAGLAHLAGLTQLNTLILDLTQVTDAGLAHLSGLAQLQQLDLCGTQITGVGLAHLTGRTQLQRLYLDGARVTDAGLAGLAGLTHLQDLSLQSNPVREAGLAHLAGLTQLRNLSLKGTKVFDVAEIQRALPNCRIDH